MKLDKYAIVWDDNYKGAQNKEFPYVLVENLELTPGVYDEKIILMAQSLEEAHYCRDQLETDDYFEAYYD